jgi:hypothetical protein
VDADADGDGVASKVGGDGGADGDARASGAGGDAAGAAAGRAGGEAKAAAGSALDTASKAAEAAPPAPGDAAKPAPTGATQATEAPGAPREGGSGPQAETKIDHERNGGSQAPADSVVVIVPGINRYHRSGCILIRFLGSDDLETSTKREAEENGCVPCRACEPQKPLSDGT